MVSIRKIPVPAATAAWKSGYAMTPTRIVIHNTANMGPAINEINYMHSTQSYTSFHFAVDDVEAVQGLELNQNGWHAGDGEYGKGNREGIGIEICYSYVTTPGLTDDERETLWKTNYKARFEKAQENAAELTAYLLNKYGWGFDKTRITKHQDYQNKYCPHRTLSNYGWTYFISLVEKKYKKMYEIKEEDKPMTDAEKKNFNALVDRVKALETADTKFDTRATKIEKNYTTLSNSVSDLTIRMLSAEKKIDDIYLEAMPRWNTVDEAPKWLKPTLQKLVDKGLLQGTGKGLKISNVLGREFVINDRNGSYGA